MIVGLILGLLIALTVHSWLALLASTVAVSFGIATHAALRYTKRVSSPQNLAAAAVAEHTQELEKLVRRTEQQTLNAQRLLTSGLGADDSRLVDLSSYCIQVGTTSLSNTCELSKLRDAAIRISTMLKELPTSHLSQRTLAGFLEANAAMIGIEIDSPLVPAEGLKRIALDIGDPNYAAVQTNADLLTKGMSPLTRWHVFWFEMILAALGCVGAGSLVFLVKQIWF